MDEDTPKSVNISKFFGAPDSSMVAAVPNQPVMSKPPILSGGLDLSNILNIIKTQIDEKHVVEDLKDNTENLRLQSLVDSLTGRVEKLTSELAGLFSLIIGDAEKRDKQKKLELKKAIQEQGEISKAVKLEALQKTTGDIAQVSQQASDEVVGKIESDRQMDLLGAALGLGGAGFLNAADKNKDNDDWSQYTGGEKLTNPVKAQEIYRYLLSKGISENQAKGIVNNIQYESGFNSAAEGDHDKLGQPQSFGLFQHNMGAGRAQKMFKAVGTDWKTDWKGQIDFALTEPEMKTYLDKSYASPAEASRAFTLDFEKPKDSENKANERLKTIETVNKLQASAIEPPPEQKPTTQGQVQPRTVATLPPTRDPSGLMKQTEPSGSTIAVLPTASTPAPAPASSINDAGADASNPIFPATNRLDPYPAAVALSINVVSA